MALISAASLKASREAIEAGVNTVVDADVDAAIADAEEIIYSVINYRIEDSAVSLTLRGRGLTRIFPTSRIRSVSAITDDGSTVDSTTYFTEAGGFVLRRTSGWSDDKNIVITGTFGYTSSDPQWKLAKRAVKLLAVHLLEATKPNSVPGMGSAGELESYTTEGAGFTFFHPRQEGAQPVSFTGYADVDRLLERLRIPVLA